MPPWRVLAADGLHPSFEGVAMLALHYRRLLTTKTSRWHPRQQTLPPAGMATTASSSTPQRATNADSSRTPPPQAQKSTTPPGPPQMAYNLRSFADVTRRDVQTRDLALVVALILGASFLALMLVVTFRKGQDDKGQVLAVGRFGAYCGTSSVVSGVAVGAFLGVPYADPRTLRFGAPVPWHREQEMFDNTAPAPSCAQTLPSLDEMNASTSEDCLHVNIWAPACGSRPCSGNRTVVVFIHGGFFQDPVSHVLEQLVAHCVPRLEYREVAKTGSNNDLHYDGRALAALGDVVVVVPTGGWACWDSFACRGVTTCPSTPACWTRRRYCAGRRETWTAFGGNKSDLVVVGHGSGASALAYHLMLGQGLSNVAPILKVVFMSESPMTRYPVPNRGEESAQNEYPNASVRLLCEEADQNKSSLLSCLRQLPVAEMLRRQRSDPREGPSSFLSSP
ncbi:cholinesterase-like [Dermacentor silvarum]|uniref:cholinesterase-like n=1 Tax=Dermacentor silvarum TaxID=543639 RepID=UPI002100780B|nr:cholinesterase-like [Dermacentor silvarum]